MANNRINEKTLLPVSMVIIFIGFTSWLTNLHYTASANSQKLDEQRVELKDLSDELRAQGVKLARIEAYTEAVYNKVFDINKNEP
jgi:hypothetical protein